MVKKLRTYI